MAENNLGSTQYFRSKPDQDLEVKEILDLAEHEHIPHQIKRGVTGSNDASAYQRAAAGCLTCVLSVPCRYIHSGASVAYLEDIQSQYELVHAFLMHA